jgi:hypothetical protein
MVKIVIDPDECGDIAVCLCECLAGEDISSEEILQGVQMSLPESIYRMLRTVRVKAPEAVDIRLLTIPRRRSIGKIVTWWRELPTNEQTYISRGVVTALNQGVSREAVFSYSFAYDLLERRSRETNT